MVVDNVDMVVDNMVGTPLWWGVQFTITFLDFVVVFVIVHALLNQRIAFSFKYLGMAVIYTVIVAPTAYFGDYYLIQIASLLGVLLLTRYIFRQKLSDSMLMFGLIVVIVIIIQTPSAGVAWSLYSYFEFDRPYAFLLGQLLSTTAVIFTCKKIKLNQWLYALQVNVALRLILSKLMILTLCIAFVINANPSLTFFLLFTFVIVLFGIALFPVIVQIYHHAIGIISLHDLINGMRGTGSAMKLTNNPDEKDEIFAKFSKKFGVDLSYLDVKIEALTPMEAMNKQVELFIQAKQNAYKEKVKIVSELYYYNLYAAVDFQSAMQWLGTLLDNAFEATRSKPIYVYVISTKKNFKIEVDNEYIGEKGNIQIIFEKGYSQKGAGRGIGLHNLYTSVTELGGVVSVEDFYAEKHNCNYIKISIKFEKNLIRNSESLKL